MVSMLLSDQMRQAYAPMISLLSAGRQEQTAIATQMKLHIRQALDDEEAGREPAQPAIELVEKYEPTIKLLMADRPIQFEAIGAMELEIRQQRDADIIEHKGYVKPPRLPSIPSRESMAAAMRGATEGGAEWQRQNNTQKPLLVMRGGEVATYRRDAQAAPGGAPATLPAPVKDAA